MPDYTKISEIMEIARNLKTFKIEELSAKQGVWDNDKNTIHLPRQFINSTGKALNLLDFSYYIVIFTNDLPKLI